MLMGALLALAGLQVASCLKVAAFNIRTFGETKMSNATLVNYIVQVSLGPVPQDRGTTGEGQRLPALAGR